MKTIEGNLNAQGLKFAIVVARFNSFITERLLEGALDAIRRAGGDVDGSELIRVPGSWEMPVVAAELARAKRHDAVICLGAVIRGETPHFDYVAGQCAQGIQKVAIEEALPVIFGVLTTNTEEQAKDRVGGKHGHAGERAAEAALEMIAVLQQVQAN